LTTNIEKLKALDAQRAQLLEDAKKEALDNAEKAVAELNELGFHYSLVEGASASPRAPRKTASQAQKREARDLPCPICHFKTTPHHDGRMHRSQKSKKPFTVEELMEKASHEGWVMDCGAIYSPRHILPAVLAKPKKILEIA
jgi:hypothetical protein